MKRGLSLRIEEAVHDQLEDLAERGGKFFAASKHGVACLALEHGIRYLVCAADAMEGGVKKKRSRRRRVSG